MCTLFRGRRSGLVVEPSSHVVLLAAELAKRRRTGPSDESTSRTRPLVDQPNREVAYPGVRDLDAHVDVGDAGRSGQGHRIFDGGCVVRNEQSRFGADLGCQCRRGRGRSCGRRCQSRGGGGRWSHGGSGRRGGCTRHLTRGAAVGTAIPVGRTLIIAPATSGSLVGAGPLGAAATVGRAVGYVFARIARAVGAREDGAFAALRAFSRASFGVGSVTLLSGFEDVVAAHRIGAGAVGIADSGRAGIGRRAVALLSRVDHVVAARLVAVDDLVELCAVAGQRAAHPARLFLREQPHAGVVGVVHVVPDGIRGGATRSGRRAAVVGRTLRVRIAEEISAGVATRNRRGAAAVIEGMLETEVVARLVCHGPPLIVGRTTRPVTPHRAPQNHDAVDSRADRPPSGHREERDVPEIPARGVGVHVHVSRWVPGEAVPVAAPVVEPGVVGRAGDATRRVSRRIGGRELELDLGVVPG